MSLKSIELLSALSTYKQREFASRWWTDECWRAAKHPHDMDTIHTANTSTQTLPPASKSTPPNKWLCFEKCFNDGGGMTIYGPTVKSVVGMMTWTTHGGSTQRKWTCTSLFQWARYPSLMSRTFLMLPFHCNPLYFYMCCCSLYLVLVLKKEQWFDVKTPSNPSWIPMSTMTMCTPILIACREQWDWVGGCDVEYTSVWKIWPLMTTEMLSNASGKPCTNNLKEVSTHTQQQW